MAIFIVPNDILFVYACNYRNTGLLEDVREYY